MALATSCALATISPGSLVLRLPAKARATHVCRASSKTETRLARDDLLGLIANEERGVKTQKNSNQREQIIKAIEALGVLGSEQTTTNDSLSATWRMLWTTEKEQLFIIEKMAPFFGTQAGDILQVIDVSRGTLNNVITFPPSGSFVVDSTIEVVDKQRVDFRCSPPY